MAERRRLDLDELSFRVVVGALSTAAVVVLVAPTVIVLLTSLTASASLRFPPDGLSFRWYRALAGAGQLQRAAGNSLYVAVVATAASAILGTLGALGIARSRSRWSRALDALFMSPLVLPALAFGFAALMAFSLAGIRLSWLTLAVGHVVVCTPIVVRTTVAALAQLDPALLESSASLGATRRYTFRRVTLPLIGRGIAADERQRHAPERVAPGGTEARRRFEQRGIELGERGDGGPHHDGRAHDDVADGQRQPRQPDAGQAEGHQRSEPEGQGGKDQRRHEERIERARPPRAAARDPQRSQSSQDGRGRRRDHGDVEAVPGRALEL